MHPALGAPRDDFEINAIARIEQRGQARVGGMALKVNRPRSLRRLLHLRQ